MTYYEKLSPQLKTVWGFSHFYIYDYKRLNIITIENKSNPIWIEVIHGKNMDNDVKMTLNQKLITDNKYLHQFGINKDLLDASKAKKVYCSTFLLRFLKQSWRRFKNKLT
jgi:hypothetical protein